MLLNLTDILKERHIPFSSVTRAYNGSSGCMCGCQGDYVSDSEEATLNTETKYSPRTTKTRYNRVINDGSAKVNMDALGRLKYAVSDDGNRTTVLYFA